MSNKIDYENVLNPAQLEAIMTVDGPVLVIAGAGSGKTRTLVYRVARLVEKGVPPENILLLTFTRKAAGEMLDRAASLTDEKCKYVSGGTFHSLAHRVLRNNAGLLGFDNSFTILDRADMEEVIQSIVAGIWADKKAVRFPRRATLANILSKAANLQQPVEELIADKFVQFLEHISKIQRLNKLYRQYKKKNQLMDYDDLIILFRNLISDSEEIRTQLGEQYRYIMVDEYQDTNGIQADIVKWLALTHQNVMVVGDDSQSIYSFRGANFRNMFDFPKLFPDVRLIKLQENYRSTQPILTLTNTIMSQAREKYTKCLFTNREDGDMPCIINTMTEQAQAAFICRSIKEGISEGRSLNDFGILFRAAYHSFELELQLTRHGIPYVKYGGFKFMESAHIKDLIAHIRIVLNRNDAISWGRVLRLLKNIGQGRSQSIINWMKNEDIPPGRVSEWPRAGKRDSGLKVLSGVLNKLQALESSPAAAVELVIDYYDPILKERFDDFPKRQKDLQQLVIIADRYPQLRGFLDDLMLEPPTGPADIEPGQKGEKLTLSTVHSSKGLEWPVIFIIWAMEGYFPSARSYSNQDDLEEERRLMYVAATRAMDRLIICYPGQESLPPWQLAEIGYRSGLSSFLQALPEDVVEYHSSGPVRRDYRFQGHPPKTFIHNQGKKSSSGLCQGDRVKHPAFGIGVISKVIEEEKVEVLFKNVGRKLLHLEYTTLNKV